MSNANITFIQSMYAAFSKGDIATIIANVTPTWTGASRAAGRISPRWVIGEGRPK